MIIGIFLCIDGQGTRNREDFKIFTDCNQNILESVVWTANYLVMVIKIELCSKKIHLIEHIVVVRVTLCVQTIYQDNHVSNLQNLL